jgi:hypothetical protein
MKQLQTLSLTRLSVLEFGQHLKSILENINLLGAGFITDTVLVNYLQRLGNSMVPYDKAVVQITKSDETAKIVEADKLRDNAITALTRQLAVYELSPNDNETEAYNSLLTLFNIYKGIQKWNFEEETNGIDNLLADLANAKYSAHAALLNMAPWVTQLANANAAFKTLFSGRTQESSAKESFDVAAMRKEMKTVYEDAANYTLSMAKAQNTYQYTKTLDVINTVRKYYHDLLAKRKPSNAGDTPTTPIPPMA